MVYEAKGRQPARQDRRQGPQEQEGLLPDARRLRLALDAARIGTWEIDLAANVGYQDRRTAEILGMPPNQARVTREEWESRIHPEDRARVREAFDRAVREEASYAEQFRALQADGQVRWVSGTVRIYHDQAGGTPRAYGVVADITDHMRAEQTLREDADKYRSIFETANNLIASFSRQGTLLDCNPRVETVLGYTRDEVVGQSGEKVFHSEDMPIVQEALHKILVQGQTHRWECRMVRKDGQIIHVTVSSAMLKDRSGGAPRTICIIQDVTELRRSLEALRKRDEQLRIAQRAAGAGMWDWDIATGNLTWSPEHYEVHGLDPSLPPSYERWLAVIHERDRQGADEALRLAMQRCADPHIEYQVVHPRRGLRWLALIGRTFCDGDGHPTRMTGLALDITERRQFMEQLRELNETLEQQVAERTAVAEQRAAQLRRLAGQLTRAEQEERRRVAQILHEHFQQLLVGARFNVSRLRSGLTDPNLLASVRKVDAALDEAIEASRSLTVELSPPILHDAGLSQALLWLGGWMRERHDLEVNVQADPIADPQDEDVRIALFVAARELLLNVIKHAGVNRAALSLNLSDDQRPRILVTDAGIGFDLGQVTASSGFGLFSVRERLELLGGRMDVQSRPGGGTRVTLLGPPMAPPVTGPVGTVVEQGPVTVPPSPPAARGPLERIRVVIADDHAIVRDGLVRLLQDYPDMEVIGQAADGQEAVDLACQMQPDVVVMDVSMPRMSGVEATRIITARCGHVRVIGLSMHARADMAERMREAGAVDYLAKSGPPEDLVAAVRESVRHRGGVRGS